MLFTKIPSMSVKTIHHSLLLPYIGHGIGNDTDRQTGRNKWERLVGHCLLCQIESPRSQYGTALLCLPLLLLLLWWLEHHLNGCIKNCLNILQLKDNMRPINKMSINMIPQISMEWTENTYLLCFWTTLNIGRSSNQFPKFFSLQRIPKVKPHIELKQRPRVTK
jgi:hypothetical protein